MTPSQLLAYLGPAFLGALVLTAIISGLFWLFSSPLRRAPQVTLLLSLFFLALTQYPFPDPATLDCRDGGVAPILQPFATFGSLHRLWVWTQNDPSIFPAKWIGNKVLQAAGMNFGLCAAIGAAFACHAGSRHPWAQALLLAIGLSFGAELTQATALWGIYPCPYRYFEIDDLIFNISGLLTGFGFWRWRQRKRRPSLEKNA